MFLHVHQTCIKGRFWIQICRSNSCCIELKTHIVFDTCQKPCVSRQIRGKRKEYAENGYDCWDIGSVVGVSFLDACQTSCCFASIWLYISIIAQRSRYLRDTAEPRVLRLPTGHVSLCRSSCKIAFGVFPFQSILLVVPENFQGARLCEHVLQDVSGTNTLVQKMLSTKHSQVVPKC